LEAQASLSKVKAEASALQQDAASALAAAKLSCGGCAAKAGQVLELQQQLQHMQAMLFEEQQQRKGADTGLEACRAELQGAKAELAAAQKARDQLYHQLYGGGGSSSIDNPTYTYPASHAGYPAGGYGGHVAYEGYELAVGGGYGAAPGSPTRGLQQLGMFSAEEGGGLGLIQRCGVLTSQLQQQEVELASLRQQLLEQQLALSEAQTSCSSAERQLQQAAGQLKAAHAAAAEGTSAAAAARKEVEGLREEVEGLREGMRTQQPELVAARAHVQKLEAQQQVLLGEWRTGLSVNAVSV
jgi:chromosome segregation ATPase